MNVENRLEQKKIFWHELTRKEMERRIKQVETVLVPIGSVEQHGPHLPLITDTESVIAVCKEVAAKLYPRILLAPPVMVGYSPHHMSKKFPGTITLRAETLFNLLLDICRSLQRQGVKKVVIMSGHGGNRNVMGLVANTARESFGLDVAGINYWDIIPQEKREEIMEGSALIPGHAGEFETSLSLYLFPEMVNVESLVDIEPDWTEGARAPQYFPWYRDEVYRHGYSDNPPTGK